MCIIYRKYGEVPGLLEICYDMFLFNSYIIAKVAVFLCSVKYNSNVFGSGHCPVVLKTCLTYMEKLQHGGMP